MGRQIVKLAWIVACASFGIQTALALDTDGDGVDDALDVCCETPGGLNVDEFGRPIGDFDGDCDVDLADIALLLVEQSGPSTKGCCLDSDCDDDNSCTHDACATGTGICTNEVVENCGECVLGGECPTELVCGLSLAGTISQPAETDTACFCVFEGEIIRISVVEQAGSGAGFNPNWRLLDAAGNPAVECGAFGTVVSADCGPLPAAGNPYQLVIEDGSRNDVGLYMATLQRLRSGQACEDAVIQCDVPLAGSISDIADEDLARFSVGTSEVVRISVVEATGSLTNFGPSWRLIDAEGNPDRVCGAFATPIDRDCGPLFPSGNPYRVEIEDGGRNEVGNYTVNLQRLTATQSCDSQSMDCGATKQVTINTAGDSDLFSFRVVAGEIIRFSLFKPTGELVGFAPSWRIVDTNGLPAVSCGVFVATATGVDCGPFPTSGNPYQMEIQDGGRSDPGSCLARLDRMASHRACDQTPLPCGTTIVRAITSAVDLDLLEFSVPEGETVRVAVFEQSGAGPNFAPSWRLIDGSGRPAPVCGAFSSVTSIDCGPLPEALNPYRLEIEDAGRNDVGSYSAMITFLTSGCP